MFDWSPATVEQHRKIAVDDINRASSRAASAQSRAENLEARIQYFEAIARLIGTFELTGESKNLIQAHVMALDRLSRGDTPTEFKPTRNGKKRFDYGEWYRRALFRYCYDVLVYAGYRKNDALEKIEIMSKETGVKLPRSGLEQAIINNFSYKERAKDKDKTDAIRRYKRMKRELLDSRNGKMTKEQAIIWCRRTLENGKNTPNPHQTPPTFLLVDNNGSIYRLIGRGGLFLYKRGDNGTLAPSYDDDDLIGHTPSI
jgi:hypothetical protein